VLTVSTRSSDTLNLTAACCCCACSCSLAGPEHPFAA